MKIAQVAKESNYLESYIKWCQTAFEVAKMEHCDEKFINSIQQDIEVCIIKMSFKNCFHARLKIFLKNLCLENHEKLIG